MSVLIVGAGLCGLALATALKKINRPAAVVEKSRGVGGRMATRRSDMAKFDHGAQFYTLSEKIEPLHERWQSRSLVETWFEVDGQKKVSARGGMTSLAKDLAADLDVRVSRKLVRLERIGKEWSAFFEAGEALRAETVVLTSPLPQALEILTASGLKFDSQLSQRVYAKALVALVEAPVHLDFPIGSRGFWSQPTDHIFSISDQKVKGVSPVAADTVVMTPAFSEANFGQSDEQNLELIRIEILKLSAAFFCQSMDLKKWRYSHPLLRCDDGFAEVQPSLYLAGDAFGGPSLNGAFASANSLFRHLIG